MNRRISEYGEIFQIAYCPRDFAAAVEFWTDKMGVGPFYRRGPLQFDNALHYGRPTDVRFSVAIAYWGDIQIELIETHNDSPSIYRDWREAGLDGVHHLCIEVADIQAARAQCIERGMKIAQEMYWDGGGAIYADTGGGPGTMVEMVQLADSQKERFAAIRAAARDWDGSDPVREG